MTGVILVVDDVPANVKLLEAKLSNEYYDVVTARDGYEAIKKAKEHKPDLVLLDVMMPGMDGFETCRQLKKDPEMAHIPVVMVTALSEPSDRVQGLEAGADDFITKPINDTALFARVKSLVRIKVLIDELRLRDQSGSQMGIMNQLQGEAMNVAGASIWFIDDDAVQAKRIHDKLQEQYQVTQFANHVEALDKARHEDTDLIIISTQLNDIDGLRLATQFKAIERMRHVPIVMLVDEDDQALMLKALDLGVNDYLVVPVDFNEMLARVKTQIRRKKYQDALKSNYQESVSMAITDGLTSLYNRHYLDTHLKNLTKAALEKNKMMSLVIMDMDHFKSVNDTYGHDVGDEVLKQLSQFIIYTVRSTDLAARYGGEEFVVLMPETDFNSAYEVAERIRKKVEGTPFIVSHAAGQISKTISIGVSTLNHEGDTPEKLLKRADNALYKAKHTGRNQVCPATREEAAGLVPLSGVEDGSASAPKPVAAPPPPPAMLELNPVVAASASPPPAAFGALPPHVTPPAPVVSPVATVPPAYGNPVPSPPAAPLPPSPAILSATGLSYDPHLLEKATSVSQAGQGSNQVPLSEGQRSAIIELKRPEAGEIRKPSAPSPIDDEPPGTF